MEMYMSVAKNTRVMICLMTVIVSLLLIGAGQVTKELHARSQSHCKEKENWEKIASDMVKNIPLEHKEAWLKAVKKDPEFFLKINTIQFVTYDK